MSLTTRYTIAAYPNLIYLNLSYPYLARIVALILSLFYPNHVPHHQVTYPCPSSIYPI